MAFSHELGGETRKKKKEDDCKEGGKPLLDIDTRHENNAFQKNLEVFGP